MLALYRVVMAKNFICISTSKILCLTNKKNLELALILWTASKDAVLLLIGLLTKA